MKLRFSAICEAFFASSAAAAFTLLTTAGLIGAVYASSSSPGAVVFCVIIGILGLSIFWHQMRRALQKSKEEEEIYKRIKPKFDSLPEDQKVLFMELVVRKILPYGSGGSNLEASGFVGRDGVLGHVYLLQPFTNAIAKAVREWEKSRSVK
jgi:hypothetical protein